MDFKEIEAFINVAKYKSFSRAAEAIYLSQPTVSSHIASLENELSTVLLDRSGREVKLTKEGSVLFEYAIKIINLRDNAISDIKGTDKKLSGLLSLASSTTPSRYLLPEFLKSFSASYPFITFNVKEGSTKEVIHMVIDGNAEMGIAGEIIPDKRLTYINVAIDDLVVISSYKKNPPLPDTISIEDLLKQNFIIRDKGSATRNVFENILMEKGIPLEKIKSSIIADSLEAVLQFVKNDLGISIASAMACVDYINSGLIRQHKIQDIQMQREIYAVIRKNRILSPMADRFLLHIKKEV